MSKKTYCDICGEEIKTVVINHSHSLPVIFKSGSVLVAKGAVVIGKDNEYNEDEHPDFCMECVVQTVANMSSVPRKRPFRLSAQWLSEQLAFAGFESKLSGEEQVSNICLIVDRFNRLQ